MRPVLAAAAVLALLAAGCGDGGDDRADRTTTTTTAPAGEGAELVGTPRQGEVTSADGFPARRDGTALLTDVRTAAHAGFGRLVFEFDGTEAPSYRVAPIDGPVRQDFSGHELDVDGDAHLEVRFDPAAGFDPLSEDAEPVYTGPDRIRLDGVIVTELVLLGDFEGQNAWAVGLAGPAAAAVAVLDDPARVVVDVVEAERPTAGWASCTFSVEGWEVRLPYPDDWVTNEETEFEHGTVPACRLFDPVDATPPRPNELVGFGVVVHVDRVDYDDVTGTQPPMADVLDEQEHAVDGRRAERREERLTEDGIRGPAGARVTTWRVDLDGRMLVASTTELEHLDYEVNRRVLDRLVRDARFRPG